MLGAARIRRQLVLGAAGLGLVVAGPAQAAKPTIYVNYTIGCTFTITDDSGKAVTTIPAGDYQILVRTPGSFGGVDLSGTYDMTACKGAVDFRLTGPGVSIATTLDDGDGDSDFLYTTFMPSSTYTAVDNHQPTVARATFTTTAASLSSSTATTTTTTTTKTVTSPPPPIPACCTNAKGSVAVTVAGTVSPTGKLTLKLGGKAVTELEAGVYVFTVNDESVKAGFFVQASGKAARTITSAVFKGRHSVVLRLTRGQWALFAAAGEKKTVFSVS